MNGKNVFDFVDPDIERKIQLLEEEQAQLVMPAEELLTAKERRENELLEAVRDRKYEQKIQSQLSNKRTLSKNKLDLDQLKERLAKRGVNSAKAEARLKEQ